VIDPPVLVSSDGLIAQSSEPGIGYRVKEPFLESVTVRTQVFGA
jgi:hypothetical protein